MTVVVNHSTPADGSFSSTGAAAWNADHTLSGVGTLAEQNANAVAITGGAINGTTVGVTTPASGAFTTLSATTPLPISSGGTAATSANAAFNKLSSYQTFVNSSGPNLDNTTAQNVFFTGTGIGCYLPDITTLPIGYSLHIVNQTNATFLVSDFNSTSIYQMPINTGAVFVYVGLGGGSQWTYSVSDLWSGDDGVSSGNTGITGTGKVVLQASASLTSPTITTAPSIGIQNASVSGGLQMIRNTDAATNSTRMYLDSSGGVGAIYNGNGSIFFNTNGSLGSSTGANQFRVAPTASAVNYVQVTGAATTGTPSISTQGSDTNVNIAYVTKGSGEMRFASNASGSNINFRVLHTTASAVNYGAVTGAAAGSAPVFSVAGTDPNIDLALTPKGTGNVRFGTHTGTVLTPTGYVEIKDSGGTIRRLLVG